MKDLKKIALFVLIVLSVLGIVGAIGSLYYCDVESSNLFATALIPVAAVYFRLLWPIVKRNLLE